MGISLLSLPWCTGYSTNIYHRELYLIIHKYPDDFRTHRLIPTFIFYIKENLHHKYLGRFAMRKAEKFNTLSPEQYGSIKAKAEDIQALNTRHLYDIIRLKRLTATRTLSYLISNYDLVVHSIASPSIQRANINKEPIRCTFTTLQIMEHSIRTSFRDPDSRYVGDKWDLPLNPPSQGMGQENGADPDI